METGEPCSLDWRLRDPSYQGCPHRTGQLCFRRGEQRREPRSIKPDRVEQGPVRENTKRQGRPIDLDFVCTEDVGGSRKGLCVRNHHRRRNTPLPETKNAKAHAEAWARKEGYTIGAASRDQYTYTVCKQDSAGSAFSAIARWPKPDLNKKLDRGTRSAAPRSG